MLKESIIFVMLILFSIEDIRKRRIDVLPLLVFLVIGILYQAITRSLTIPEICGGAFLGVCLLGIAKVTGESLGYMEMGCSFWLPVFISEGGITVLY